MDRENAETRVREMEDQLAEFQDEMRKETGGKTVTQRHNYERNDRCSRVKKVAQIGLRVQDLMSCQAQLMEVCQQKKKLEESLRQRERELTALKGALKDEVASHDKEMEVLREQYSGDMEKLRGSMEQVSQVCDHHKLTRQTTTVSPSHLFPSPVHPSASVALQKKKSWKCEPLQ